MPKQARLNAIKAFQCYTIEEAAEVTGVSPRTIRKWIEDGLPVMNGSRPALVRGDDLRDYIKAQRSKRSVKTHIDTFYCVRCRAERRPAGGWAECEIRNRRAKLTAFCEVCETVVSKPVKKVRIPEISRTLDLEITQHE